MPMTTIMRVDALWQVHPMTITPDFNGYRKYPPLPGGGGIVQGQPAGTIEDTFWHVRTNDYCIRKRYPEAPDPLSQILRPVAPLLMPYSDKLTMLIQRQFFNGVPVQVQVHTTGLRVSYTLPVVRDSSRDFDETGIRCHSVHGTMSQ